MHESSPLQGPFRPGTNRSGDSPENEHALGLTQALEHGAVGGVLGQHGLEAQQDLLNGLHELILVGVPCAHLGDHALSEGVAGREGGEAGC